MRPIASPSRRVQVAAFWALVFAVISAVSRPAEIGLEWLAAIGASDAVAPWAAHAIPVLVAALVVGVGSVLTPRLSKPWRLLTLGVLGAVCGATLSLFLDAFAAADGLLSWAGPMSESALVDVIAWAAAAISVLCGLIAQGVAWFGSSALRAMAMEEPTPSGESVEVRRRDRGQLAWSALGLIGQGMVLIAAVLSQTALDPSAAAQGGIAALALAGCGLFTWSSLKLWSTFDELQRRFVMDAYAWSAILVTPVLFGWVVLEGLGLLTPIDGYVLFVGLILIQTVLGVMVQIKAGVMAPAAKEAA